MCAEQKQHVWIWVYCLAISDGLFWDVEGLYYYKLFCLPPGKRVRVTITCLPRAGAKSYSLATLWSTLITFVVYLTLSISLYRLAQTIFKLHTHMQGPLNTYARAGKLFPGPHLYAGAGLVCLWAIAVACVPAMQKGNDAARTLHIGANVAGLGLFGWQVVSGIPILLKVIEKTSWP
jgi:Protein of unknown function (DUF4079)